jgi:hypothetical protein
LRALEHRFDDVGRRFRSGDGNVNVIAAMLATTRIAPSRRIISRFLSNPSCWRT